MNEKLTINDVGLEVVKWPITKVRVGKVDDRWLVEYRRKAKWVLDRWWWFDDGKYIDYREAVARAQAMASLGYVTTIRNATPTFDVTPYKPAEPTLKVVKRVVTKPVTAAATASGFAAWKATQGVDLDGDGDIDEDDFKLYQSAKRWEELGWENPEDLNGDGIIDIEDYKLYVQGDRWDDKKDKGNE